VLHGGLEPVVNEVGVIADDHPHVRDEFSNNVVDQTEQAVDRFAVGVPAKGSGALVNLGAIPDLGGLVEHEKSGYWTVLPDEVAMQGKAAADPTLVCSYFRERHNSELP
jgi:hypothetical protein